MISVLEINVGRRPNIMYDRSSSSTFITSREIKMSKILKICKEHGELTIENIRVEKSTGLLRCKFCRIKQNAKYRSENLEKHRANAREYGKLHREKKLAWTKQDRKINPEKYRQYTKNLRLKHGDKRVIQDILRMFKLTREQYDQMFLNHNNICAICNNPETKKSRTEGKICRLAVDHCHTKSTNDKPFIRGLLCHECNTGIGKFKDNIELICNAIIYLNKYDENNLIEKAIFYLKKHKEMA